MATPPSRQLVTLGMFIIDEFEFLDQEGRPTGKAVSSQIGGGGTYAIIGARIWLTPGQLGMIVDRGNDFPQSVQATLDSYGSNIWHFRDHVDGKTTRAMNSYRGDYRGFKYLTSRIRLTPRDLENTSLARPATLHFICSPSRALEIMSEVKAMDGWFPTTIYEPIPDRCVPEELPALVHVLPCISVLSPNAEEALSLLSLPLNVTRPAVEEAATKFLDLGVGPEGGGAVIIRSGALGAYVTTRKEGGQWVDAFWTSEDAERIVDVTGAGNSFLGGLAAGIYFTGADIYKATFYASVSASFIIEQLGLPNLSFRIEQEGVTEIWNEDSPQRRLEELLKRHKAKK